MSEDIYIVINTQSHHFPLGLKIKIDTKYISDKSVECSPYEEDTDFAYYQVLDEYQIIKESDLINIISKFNEGIK